MAKKIPNISTILFTVMLIVSLVAGALAQTKSPGRSRLDIGKSPKTTVQTKAVVKFPLKVDFKLGEIRYKKPDVVNQYYKNLLLSPAVASKATSKNVDNTAQEVIKHDALEKNDKLFSSEKINVSVAYPNPANVSTTIDYHFMTGLSDVKVVLFNVFASQVAEYQFDKSDKKITIPTESLASGVYYYQLIVDGKMVTSKKLLIRH